MKIITRTIILINTTIILVMLALLFSKMYTNYTDKKAKESVINTIEHYVIYNKGDILADGESRSRSTYRIYKILTYMTPPYKTNYPHYSYIEYDSLKYNSYEALPHDNRDFTIEEITTIHLQENWKYVSYGNSNNDEFSTMIFAIDPETDNVHFMFEGDGFYVDAFPLLCGIASEMDEQLF